MNAFFGLLRFMVVLMPAMSFKDWMKKNFPPAPKPASPTVEIQIPRVAPGPRISTWTPPLKPLGKAASWIPAGQPTTIRGYNITAGLIYVGSNLTCQGGYGNDACLIDPRLDVTKPGSQVHPEQMGYWPGYSSISANSRARYLRWLAGGRTDPNADIGLVFLFFYGLERRLLIDGQSGKVTPGERGQIVAEIMRLRQVYTSSNSFMSYSAGLLNAEWVLYHNGDPAPDIGDRYDYWGPRIRLAQYAQSGQPLPADVALSWLRARQDYKLRTPARRCGEEFAKLFAVSYAEMFGQGVVVKPGKRMLSYQYHAASSTVRMDKPVTLHGLPDPFNYSSPEFKKLCKLADECTDEMEAYSRMLGKKPAESSKMSTAAKLPAVLACELPEVQYLRGHLESTCTNGPARIVLKGIYETFAQEQPQAFNKKECEELAETIEAAGFGLAPDVRYHYMKIGSDGVGVVFPGGHGKDFKHSPEFFVMGTVLRLGALVAQTDMEVSRSEAAVLQRLIDNNKKLSDAEKRSLSAFLLWCLGTRQTASGLKKTFESMGQEEKQAIGRILIAVAGADGRIDPREVNQLEKLYVSLGLAREQVASDIHEVVASAGPVTVSRGDAAPTYAIPSEQEEAAKSFTLDTDLIARYEMETAKVGDVLAEIFTGQEEPAEVVEEEVEYDEFEHPLAKLETPYRELLKRLLAESEWERSAIEAVCAELGVMPDGAMETLNEWAFENLDAPLIENGEPVYIDIELVRGIIDEQ